MQWLGPRGLVDVGAGVQQVHARAGEDIKTGSISKPQPEK